MRVKEIKNMAQALVTTLTSRPFLDKSQLSAPQVRQLAGRAYWEQVFSARFPLKERVSCAEVLEMCRAPMAQLSDEPTEGWLAFLYDFGCTVLFPDEEKAARFAPYAAAAHLYLTVLQFMLDREREVMAPEAFVDFELLVADDYERFESRQEYAAFLKAWRENYVYEVFRLNGEATSYKTLEHVAGVHHVAMALACGLFGAGVPIDLALVSGAAAGHDIGKFGCKPNEAVPHMHYYYTDLWFRRHQMTYIGHIAANHSTWDLEPERLSVESLVLIYADFCVKQERVNGDNVTRISDLEAAFAIILDKLENVDEAKAARYRFVYSRLKDFHDYMLSLDVEIPGEASVHPPEMPPVSLRSAEETVQSLVYMGVETNIAVMHRMAAGRQFGNFLESARSTTNQRHLQIYLRLFDRYTVYTNDEQKRQTAAYLYELMMHREGDIRVEAARILGKIIAQFNYGYRKRYPSGMKHLGAAQAFDLWQETLFAILRPDLKLNEVQKLRIRSNSKNVLASLLVHASAEDGKTFLGIFLDCFDVQWDAEESFALLNAALELPLVELSEKEAARIGDYALARAVSPAAEEALSAWRVLRWLIDGRPNAALGGQVSQMLAACDTTGDATRTFLKYVMRKGLGEDTRAEEAFLFETDIVPDIFLDNLQAATPWIVKAVNIHLLSSQLAHAPERHRLHIAAHLSNLLKVNDIMVVPRDAGQALSQLFPVLRIDERNEIMMELIHALEVADARYSSYIPEYLARTLLWLPLAQLDEMIAHLRGLLSSTNDGIVMRALDTIGHMLCLFHHYPSRFDIDEQVYCLRRDRLLGAVLKGIVCYREDVRQEALLVLSDVFYNEALPDNEKNALFRVGCRKMLYIMSELEESSVGLFARAAAVSALSHFISCWRMDHDGFDIPLRDKVAFMPGTFDPFTQSHMEIVREICDRGYEVYLAVDEFSWSKKAQPHLIRRKIVNMSVADVFHVNVFPHHIPINIANPRDIRTLKNIFAPRQVYMVAGSDVISGASSYRKPVEDDSIHTINHIIFRRGDTEEAAIAESLRTIRAAVDVVDLPPRFRHISSTMLRENIDLNRDVSNLVDPMVQGYIYANSLYLREPEDKPLADGKVIAFERVDVPDGALLAEMRETVLYRSEQVEAIFAGIEHSGDGLILLRNMMQDNRLTGVIRGRVVTADAFYDVLGDVDLADQVRRRTTGNLLLLSGLYTAKDALITDPAQLLLTEALALGYEYGCHYAMYFQQESPPSDYILNAVCRQGFVPAEQIATDKPVYLVDMREPIVILRNLQAFIKAPLVTEPAVTQVIERGYRELQLAMTALYPGQLVLTLAAEVIFPRMVEKITAINGVPNETVTPRVLGENMCVPFGRILRERVIPNTVTKTLHTDAVYKKDLSDYTVEAFSHYMPLADQVRMIRSFDRPIILVDDIMNLGKRFYALETFLNKESVPIRKMVFGVLTGVGRDRMAQRGVDCDSVYYVPNVRKWYVESNLYPFIGGDTVDRACFNIAEVSPSMNPILPYTDPQLDGADEEAVVQFSACCIKNARDIFYAMEECYRARFGRNLTIERLGEVITVPSAPDRGECVAYDSNLAASVYLDNDLAMLRRLYRRREGKKG